MRVQGCFPSWGGFFFVCVAVFSNFDKCSSVTKVPVAAGGRKRGAELLSCVLRSLPHGHGKAPAAGSVTRGCPHCPFSLCPVSCAATPPGGAARPHWGQVTAGTVHSGWGQREGPAQAPCWGQVTVGTLHREWGQPQGPDPVPSPALLGSSPRGGSSAVAPAEDAACATPQPLASHRALPCACARGDR